MKTCKNCAHKESHDELKFCPKCGTAFEEEAQRTHKSEKHNDLRVNKLAKEKFMTSKFDAINEMSDTKIFTETLKLVYENPSFTGMLQCNINWEAGTAGGKVFWKDLAEFYGWRFQQNSVFKQVRLIDPENSRKAWGNYDNMLAKCKSFLVSQSQSPASSESTSVASDDGLKQRLAKLNALYADGLIAEEDFQRKKDEILSEL